MSDPVTDLPIKLPPARAAFSRIMTVVRKDGKHVVQLTVNGKLSEIPFDTHEQAVARIDEERKKGPLDYVQQPVKSDSPV